MDKSITGKLNDEIAIYIDDILYEVDKSQITGAELRELAHVDMNSGIWEMVPGNNNDRLVGIDDIIELKPDIHFCTGKKLISPSR